MNNFVFEPKTRFLDPEKILFQAGLKSGAAVADLGGGSGFYAVAAAKIAGAAGKVFVIDIMETSLNHVASEARHKGLGNIKTVRADLELPEAGNSIESGSIDLVIIANILHQIGNKERLFEHAYRLLKSGGRVVVVDWNSEVSPIGPASSQRVSENTAIESARKKALNLAGRVETDRYHYGLIFSK